MRKAGIKIADIIAKADGKEVKTVEDLNKIRDNYKGGRHLAPYYNKGKRGTKYKRCTG